MIRDYKNGIVIYTRLYYIYKVQFVERVVKVDQVSIKLQQG